MGCRAATLVGLVALTGCTLLSLDDLNDAGAAGGGVSTGANGGEGGGNGGESSSNGGGGQNTGAAGGNGGAPTVYADCVKLDDPAIFFHMEPQTADEPNFGAFLGDGLYDGPNVSAPSLLPSITGPTATKFQAGGTLQFTTAEFDGGYQPITLELWVRFADDLTVGGAERTLFSAEPAPTALRLQPRVVQDGEDRLTFVVGEAGVGARETFAFGDFIDQPDAAFHIVGVYRLNAASVFDNNGVGSDMALYVNGESVSTTGSGDTMVVADVMQNLVIGGDLGSDGSGAIFDEVAIYTRELSANDVAAHYAAALGGLCE